MNIFLRNRVSFALWALSIILAFPALSLHAQTIGVGPYGSVYRQTTAADTATLTINQSVGMVVGTPTAAANYTTPTAVLMCRAFPTLKAVSAATAAQFAVSLLVKNTSAGAFTITMVGGTGVTVSGTATVAQSHMRLFVWHADSCVSGSEAWHLFSGPDSAF